jgi:phage FluMu protein Com
MPVTFECSCGKQLRVADEFAGKRIRCPACKEVQTVPETAAASPITAKAPFRPAIAPVSSGPAMVRFECSCGKVMQAKAEFAGRSTRCPACQSTLTIPDGDETTGPIGIRADRPIPRQAAAMYDEEDEAPVRRGGRRIRKRQRKSPWLWVGLAAGMLLLIGGGIGAFFWLRGGKTPAEFALVPDDAAMFVTVRVSDLWNLDLTKRLLKEAPLPPGQGDLAVLAEQKLGLSPADVERATMVFMNFDALMNQMPGFGGMGGMGGIQPGGMRPGAMRPGGGGPPGMVGGGAVPVLFVIVNTAKPYDKQKLLGALGPNATESKHKDKSFHTTAQGDAIYFADERTFVIGPPPGVQKAIEQHVAPKKPKDELADALQLAGGKNHVVWWIRLTPGMKQNIPAPPEAAGKKVDFGRDVTFVLDLGNTVALDFSVSFDSSSKAAQSKTKTEEEVKQAKQMIPGLKMMLLGQPKELQQLAAWAEKVFNGAVVEQKGKSVHVSMKGDVDVDATVAGMKALAGKFGGALR